LQYRPPIGFDHNYCLIENKGKLRKVARVDHKKSGRYMNVYSNSPGLHFYTGHWLGREGILCGKEQRKYG